MAKKRLAKYGVAIHGFWISATLAEMTGYIDTHALMPTYKSSLFVQII